MNQIDECKKLGGSEETALSPAVIAAREKEKRLSEEYKALWEGRRLETPQAVDPTRRGSVVGGQDQGT